MKFETAFCWSCGLKKGGEQPANEDSLLLEQIRTKQGQVLLAAVSDGIGGLAEGETASGFLIEELRKWFFGEMIEILSRHRQHRKRMHLLERSLRRQLYHSAEMLSAYGRRKKRRLGATFSAVVFLEKDFLICSVGDSRVLKVTGEKIFSGKMLSGKEKTINILTRDDVDEKGRLIRCIGSEGWYPLQFRRGSLRKGELLVVCTDGFWRRLAETDFRTVEYKEEGLRIRRFRKVQKKEVPLKKRMNILVEELRNRGEMDDITAVCISRICP